MGFRGAVGYESHHFRLAVESGFTRVIGTNPLVLDIDLIPLAVKFGYALPIRWGVGVQADISFGYMFSRTSRYETAIDMVLDNLLHDKERSRLAGARLYATWTSPRKFLKIFAGGGADVLFETEGPLPMPLIEAGLSLKPGTLAGLSAGRRKDTKEPSAEVFEPVYADAVYFEKNSVIFIETYRSILDEAGEQLKNNPEWRITFKAYFAPEETAEWQIQYSSGTPALSDARARWCADYLRTHYGIDALRYNKDQLLMDNCKINNNGGQQPLIWFERQRATSSTSSFQFKTNNLYNGATLDAAMITGLVTSGVVRLMGSNPLPVIVP